MSSQSTWKVPNKTKALHEFQAHSSALSTKLRIKTKNHKVEEKLWTYVYRGAPALDESEDLEQVTQVFMGNTNKEKKFMFWKIKLNDKEMMCFFQKIK